MIIDGYLISDSRMININLIQAGDTVIHNGVLKTVSALNIKRDKFMGASIFGDSYHAGNKLVHKVKLGINKR